MAISIFFLPVQEPRGPVLFSLLLFYFPVFFSFPFFEPLLYRLPDL